jgi:hypothetical protein
LRYQPVYYQLFALANAKQISVYADCCRLGATPGQQRTIASLSELATDATAMQPGSATGAGPKARLLTLADLDGRTRAAQTVSKTMTAIAADLGGSEHLSTGEHQIIKRAALTGAMLEDMAARWLLGEAVDPALYATLSNAERRLLETVGLKRRARDITPSLGEYLTSGLAKPVASHPAVNQPASE